MTKTSASQTEKLIFKPVFEALLAGIEEKSTPAFRQELAALGVRAEKLLPGYSYDVWEKTVLAASRLFTELSPADALAEVGRRLAVATVNSSTVNKTLMPVLRVLGPARALRRIYSRTTGENYNQTTFGTETPKSLEMTMLDVGTIPDLPRGSIVGIGQAMGLPFRARLLEHAASTAKYLIEWD